MQVHARRLRAWAGPSGRVPRVQPCRASGPPVVDTDPKEQILQLLAEGHSFYEPNEEMSAAVERLLAMQSPTLAAGEAVGQGVGTGTWQVFWAPHIASMSSVLQTKFEPIIYKFFPDGSLVSNVKFNSPLWGTGWLSASGRMFPKDESTVEVRFDQFWVDLGDTLQEALPEGGGGVARLLGVDVPLDAILTSLGRAAFFPQLALFPIAYLDDELAVFEFPPLQSKIAITRLGEAAVATVTSIQDTL